MKAFTEQSKQRSLIALYDTASTKWQDAIDRLGYPGAYAELICAVHATGLPFRSNGLKVLDVGTGTGALAKTFAESETNIQTLDLLDPSQNMLDIAAQALRTRPVRPVHGAIGKRQLPEAEYDVILCAHTIEHLSAPDAAFAWFQSLLAPDGLLVMSISKPHWCTSLIRWRWGHKAYRPRDVHQALRAAQLDHVTDVLFSQGPPSRTSVGYIAKN